MPSMLTLPIYLRGSTYYLHTRIGSHQFKRSLNTGDKKIAIVRALHLIEALQMPFDLSKIRTYKIDVKNGVFEAEGDSDHKRMLEALSIIHKSPVSLSQIPVGNTVTHTSQTPPEKGLRLMELVDKFFLLKSHRKEATVIAYKNTAQEFSDFLSNPLLRSVMVSDVTRYQEKLAKKGNSARTIDNKVGILRTLLNFAIKQGYYHEKNPAENRALQSKTDKLKNGWEIFTDEEIKTIFQSDFLKIAKTRDPDYYWTLVLGLISGCRISEITGIQKEQFKTNDEDIFYLQVDDSKTIAGTRQIPLPKKHLDPSLANFLGSRKEQVFKYKSRLGKGSGNAVGKKFKRHLEELGIVRPKLVFHSLRKYANDYFMRKGVPIEARCQYFGHEIDNINVQVYTKKLTLREMQLATLAVQVEMMKKATIFIEASEGVEKYKI